jgi:hypothetical protein
MPLRLAELHWSAERIYIWKRNPVQIYVEQANIPYERPNCFSDVSGRWDEANYGIWGEHDSQGFATAWPEDILESGIGVGMVVGGVGGNEYLHWEDQWHMGALFARIFY